MAGQLEKLRDKLCSGKIIEDEVRVLRNLIHIAQNAADLLADSCWSA